MTLAAIDLAQEALGVAPMLGDDAVGVVRAILLDVRDGRIEIGHHP